MDIERLQYTKDWKNPSDFPTIETSETKVRSDMQQLYDETRDYLNDVLSPTVEAETQDIRDTYATKEELDQVVAGISPDIAATEAVLAGL